MEMKLMETPYKFFKREIPRILKAGSMAHRAIAFQLKDDINYDIDFVAGRINGVAQVYRLGPRPGDTVVY